MFFSRLGIEVKKEENLAEWYGQVCRFITRFSFENDCRFLGGSQR